MCGIVGVLTTDGRRVDPGALARMTAMVAHRGPDAQATRILPSSRGEMGLGHTRLRIIDLSAAAEQPMTSADGNL